MFHVINLTCGPSVGRVPSKDRSRNGSKCSDAAVHAKNSTPSVTLAHMSGQNVLSIKDSHRGQQQSKYVSAADAAIVKEAVHRGHRFQHVPPEVHVGGEEIRPQIREEFYPAYDVEHYIYGQRGDDGHRR